jgi:lantibiotic transport system permease protein
MNVFARALRAETLKMNRTLALWLTLLTPAALVFLEVVGATQRQGQLSSLPPDINRWSLLFEDLFSIWVILVFPLFITLETALLGQVEHGNGTWKLVYTQPVPRWATLAAKQIWGLALVALGMVALIVLTFIGGTILDILMPELAIEPPIPWKDIFTQVGIAILASGIILGVHTWIALRSRSFVVASAVGITMTIAGLILAGLEWTKYFPWTMPGTALNNYHDGLSYGIYLVIGVVGWLVLSILANLELKRLEIRN